MEERRYEKYFVTECTGPRPESWGPVGPGSLNMGRVEESCDMNTGFVREEET